MRLYGAAILLPSLFNVYFFAAAIPPKLQDEKEPGLENGTQLWANLHKELTSSLKLSRQILRKTQNLTRHYLAQRLPGAQFAFVSHLGMLPTASLDLSTWLSLSDHKRLSHMAKILTFYQGLTQQLRNHEATKRGSTLIYQCEDLDVHLRDLIHHVNYQISHWGLPSEDQPEPTVKPLKILQHQSAWRNHQEGYLILHSLESVLCRVVRDFLMLRMKAARNSSLPRDPKARVYHSLPF